jgi:hypothetical protein
MKKLIMMMAIMFCFIELSFSQLALMYNDGNRLIINDVKIKDHYVYYKQLNYQYIESNLSDSFALQTNKKKLLINLDSIIFLDNSFNIYSPKLFVNAHDYELYNMRINLNKKYKQYKKGTTMYYLGIGFLSSATITLLANNSNPYINNTSRIVLYSIGSIFVISGKIIQLDSNKYLKQASIQYSISPMNAGFKINF